MTVHGWGGPARCAASRRVDTELTRQAVLRFVLPDQRRAAEYRDQPLRDAEAARPSKPRLLLFAFGDFAFNIFWQSVMLFLLFYYTDALDIPIAVAATTYMIASVWDGIASFAAGVLVDRRHGP